MGSSSDHHRNNHPIKWWIKLIKTLFWKFIITSILMMLAIFLPEKYNFYHHTKNFFRKLYWERRRRRRRRRWWMTGEDYDDNYYDEGYTIAPAGVTLSDFNDMIFSSPEDDSNTINNGNNINLEERLL